MWDAATGALRTALKPPKPGQVARPSFSPDGKVVAAATADGVVLFDAESGEVLGSVPGDRASRPRFLAGGKRLLVDAGNRTTMYDATTRRPLAVVESDFTFGIDVAPDGASFATTDGFGRMTQRSADDGAVLREWRFPGVVWGVFFGSDGRHLVTSNGNGTAYVLRLFEGPPKK